MNLEDLKPGCGYELTDYVEWIVVHKGCGKPLTGMSPKNGWCYCLMATGKPPEMKEVKGQPVVSNDSALLTRCEAAEKEVVKLTEKLDKASKRIAELVKKDL